MNQYLRSMSATEQVGAMFIFIFGALALAGIVIFLLSLRDQPQTAEGDERVVLLARAGGVLRSSWVMAIVFWIGWLSGDTTATVLFGLVSFFALREFLTLSPTRRGDHRSLVLAFFVILPLQYVLVATRHFDLFTVFIPVYVFLAIPVVSALANDPHRYLERNAKLQWGIMVCIYGMSHVPALLLLDFPGFRNKSAFVVIFLVLVVQTCMVTQYIAARRLRRAPAAPDISSSFNWPSWWVGVGCGSLLGALLAGVTPFAPGQALVMAAIACVAGSLGHLVMKAIRRDRGIPNWGLQGASVTGTGGLLDRVDALCFAAPVFFHSVRWYFSL
jgi:phosphatidate cytidylyltransferase